MYDELKKLYDEYKEACDMPTTPAGGKKLPANHIEDENKSVKWNREFVKANNDLYLATVSEMRRRRSLAMNKVQAEVEKYIMEYAEVSQKGAQKIFEFSYDRGHSDGIYSVFEWIETLVDLFEDCKEE